MVLECLTSHHLSNHCRTLIISDQPIIWAPLLKVIGDIFEAFDFNWSAVLVVLDQSATMGCTDHDLLLHQVEYMFCVTGSAQE
jgi:hypothetical protein